MVALGSASSTCYVLIDLYVVGCGAATMAYPNATALHGPFMGSVIKTAEYCFLT